MSVMNITSENFEQEIMESDRPVLLDFWASWCGPCRMVSPIVDEIAEDHPEIRVGKINVDEQPELAGQFGVMSIPSLFYMENGKVVRKTMGAKTGDPEIHWKISSSGLLCIRQCGKPLPVQDLHSPPGKPYQALGLEIL